MPRRLPPASSRLSEYTSRHPSLPPPFFAKRQFPQPHRLCCTVCTGTIQPLFLFESHFPRQVILTYQQFTGAHVRSGWRPSLAPPPAKERPFPPHLLSPFSRHVRNERDFKGDLKGMGLGRMGGLAISVVVGSMRVRFLCERLNLGFVCSTFQPSSRSHFDPDFGQSGKGGDEKKRRERELEAELE